MATIDAKIPEKEAAMLLQVHDELVFEIPARSEKREVRSESISKKIQAIMEQIIELKVPIITDATVGPNWAEMEPLS